MEALFEQLDNGNLSDVDGEFDESDDESVLPCAPDEDPVESDTESSDDESALNTSGDPENYLGYLILAYGVTSNDSKVLALSEFNNSLAVKFTTAVKNFVGYRERTTWLLYNVHNLGSGNQCGDRPFNFVRLFCMALKGSKEPMCQG
ncbi:hypothetical protein MRX96_044823 [Rhipicephalus microplus]